VELQEVEYPYLVYVYLNLDHLIDFYLEFY
jgi:hypothetical protein